MNGQQAEIYHRTFLPDGSFGPACDHACHTMPAAGAFNRPPMVDFSKIPGAQPSGPAWLPATVPQQQLPKPQPYNPGLHKRHSAYQLATPGLYKTHIVEKPDQDFRSYATPFELRYSTLLSKRRFIPVVEGYTVVGHFGTVRRSHVFMPNNHAPWGVNQLLEEGVPLFIAQENPDEMVWNSLGSPYVSETVLTGVDGEVVAGFGFHDHQALEESDFWLLDAIFLGKGVAGVGLKLAGHMVKSLMRKGSSRSAKYLFAGPTRKLGEEAVERIGKKAAASRSAYDPRTGMTEKHFRAFQDSAAATQRIAIVRNTNREGIRLIEAGCPGKPMQLKFHTSPRTGVVTAENADEIKIAYEHGYFVVDADGVARRKVMQGAQEVVEDVRLTGAFWQVEKGQVIEAATRKPVVGDYDLMGVIDPEQAGQNLALVWTEKGGFKEDVSSPIVEQFKQAVNAKMDRPRVLHGAQDQYAGFRGGATAFFPDGKVVYLPDEAAVKAFYDGLGRQTIKGAYPRPPAGTPVVDELAARRAARR